MNRWKLKSCLLIKELEIALDHANKAYADAQKTIKKHQEQIRELQLQVQRVSVFV